jgi:hypothetical protein
MSNPWFKFFPTDWRADPALRMCSPAARGVWIDMICLMHEATPYGHLLINGHCPTDAQLAVLLGMPPEQFSEIQGELEQAGVFSRTREGVIYSRKMTRSAKKAATARKNGRKGGNPSLCNNGEKSASDNLKDKGGVKTQKPEPRSQILKKEAKASQKKRGTRLQDDWVLPSAWGEWALSQQWPEPVIRAEAEKFKDYWHSVAGQKGVKLDWFATWRNWMRNANPPKVLNGGNNESPSNTDRLQRVITAAATGTSGKDWG